MCDISPRRRGWYVTRTDDCRGMLGIRLDREFMVDAHKVRLEVVQQLDPGAVACVDVLVNQEEEIRGLFGRVCGTINGRCLEDIYTLSTSDKGCCDCAYRFVGGEFLQG